MQNVKEAVALLKAELECVRPLRDAVADRMVALRKPLEEAEEEYYRIKTRLNAIQRAIDSLDSREPSSADAALSASQP